MSKEFLRIILFVVVATCFSILPAISQNSGFYRGQYSDSAWNTLLNSVKQKRDILQNRVNQAKNQNLETSYATGSITTADKFMIYANRDRENSANLATYYANFQFLEKAFAQQIKLLGIADISFAEYTPFQQLFLCNNVLDNAIAEINDQLSGKIALPKIQDFFSGPLPTLPNNKDHYEKNGKPMFPATFWGMPDEADLMNTIGNLGEVFFSPRSTEGPDGFVKAAAARTQGRNLVSHASSYQSPSQVHITHQPVPGWMLQAHPEIDDFRRGFVHYDINNPKTYEFNKNMLSSLAKEIDSKGNAGGEVIYVISNEPRWEIGEGSVEANLKVSQHTRNAHLAYLEAEYGNIGALNTEYGTNFNNFAAVGNAYQIPVDADLRGTAPWYDWMRFNMNSVTAWHKNLKTSVISEDADAKTSIKIRGRDFEDNKRDHGLDIEELMDLQEVVGFDNHTTPRETHFRLRRPYTDWLTNYAMEWREQAIMIDFSKSLYPNKPTFDSEWHGLATSGWANYSIDRDYTKSALWMAFTNGLSVMSAWWWYRETEDGSRGPNEYKEGDLQGKTATVNNTSQGPLHQPVGFDTFGRTIKELNALSETVVTLAPEKRDFLIYYTEEAAIQDPNYVPQMARIYEALKVLNYKVGFTTPKKIATQSHNPKAIIVPPTRFSTADSYNKLRNYKNANSGVRVVAVQDISGGKGENYKKNEKGGNANYNTNFINRTVTYNDDVNQLLVTLRNALPSVNLPVALNIKTENGNSNAYGVFANFGQAPNGNVVFSLNNISKDRRRVELPGGNYVNMLTGVAVARNFVMDPYDVILIEVGGTVTGTGGPTAGGTGTGGPSGGGNPADCMVLNSTDFENGTGIWIDGGLDAARVSSNAASGNFSMRLRDDSGVGSSIFTGNLNLASAESVNIKFSAMPRSMEPGEGFFLELSTNGGTSFTKVKTWIVGTDFQNSSRFQDNVEIPGNGLNNNSVLRFTCDGSTNSDIVFLDDIVIEKCASSTGGNSCTPGTPCDDGDVCTTGETYNSNCNCVNGSEVDNDNDGICAAEDSNDNDPCVPDSTQPGCNTVPPTTGGCTLVNLTDFESGLGIWNDGGTDAMLRPDFSTSGTNSLRIRDNSGRNSSIFTNNLSLNSYATANVSFNYTARGMEAGEDFVVEVSLNGGNTYSIVKSFVAGVDFRNREAKSEVVEISGFNLNNSTVIRFRCDASTNTDAIYLDDIMIEGCTSSLIEESDIDLRSREDLSERSLKLYPNPVSNKLFLETEGMQGEPVSISVYTNFGKLVRQERVTKMESNYTMNTDDLDGGNSFLLQLITEDGEIFIRRFVKI